MSYLDDQIRQQRQSQPKPKLSRSDIERNKKILNDIVEGNKRKRDTGVEKDLEKEEIILKDGFKFLDRKSGHTMPLAEKRFQEVKDYYGE